MLRLLFTLLFAFTLSIRAQEITLDRLPAEGFAASVEDQVITIGDVLVATRAADQQMRMRYSGRELEMKRYEVFLEGLDRLIDRALMIEEFKTIKELAIPERMVDAEMTDIVSRRYDNDRAALLQDLADQRITIEEYRDMIRENLMVQIMRSREIGERIVVSPKQILEAYEAREDRFREPAAVDLRLIFKRAGDAPDATRDILATARSNILAGATFADVAREVSEDPTATSGGNWGWVEPDQFREEFKRALDQLEPGEISEPVETPEGFYLLMIENRREENLKTFEEVRDQIAEELRAEQIEDLSRNWLNRLRNKFSVIYHIPTPPPAP
jgi:peptidyl-prolyl cis-trans isomerase SurA